MAADVGTTDNDCKVRNEWAVNKGCRGHKNNATILLLFCFIILRVSMVWKQRINKIKLKI